MIHCSRKVGKTLKNVTESHERISARFAKSVNPNCDSSGGIIVVVLDWKALCGNSPCHCFHKLSLARKNGRDNFLQIHLIQSPRNPNFVSQQALVEHRRGILTTPLVSASAALQLDSENARSFDRNYREQHPLSQYLVSQFINDLSHFGSS